MKKKLFTVVMVVSVYVLFVAVFAAADMQITQLVADVELSDNSAVSSSSFQSGITESKTNFVTTLRRPMPKPPIPKPRPDDDPTMVN